MPKKYSSLKNTDKPKHGISRSMSKMGDQQPMLLNTDAEESVEFTDDSLAVDNEKMFNVGTIDVSNETLKSGDTQSKHPTHVIKSAVLNVGYAEDEDEGRRSSEFNDDSQDFNGLIVHPCRQSSFVEIHLPKPPRFSSSKCKEWVLQRTSKVKERAIEKIGLIYMILSTVVFCGMGMSVKGIALSGERIPTLEIVLLRGGIGTIISIGLLLTTRGEHPLGPQGTRLLLLLRGLLGFFAIATGFWTLTVLSVADSTVLGFLSPVFTGIFGKLILGEKYETSDAIAGIISLGGVLCIARPSFIFGDIFQNGGNGQNVDIPLPDNGFATQVVGDALSRYQSGSTVAPTNYMVTHSLGDMIMIIQKRQIDSPTSNLTSLLTNATSTLLTSNETISNATAETTALPPTETEWQRLAGILSGILSAIFVAAALITIRKLSSRVHIYHVMSYFHWTSIPCALFLAPFLPPSIEPNPWILPQKPQTWLLLFSTSLCGVFGQLLLSKGLKLEKAGKAATMNYIQAVFAFFGEWMVWGVVPHWMSLLGGSVVVASVLFVAFIKK